MNTGYDTAVLEPFLLPYISQYRQNAQMGNQRTNYNSTLNFTVG